MWLILSLRPLPHGALGFWDEVLNLLPLVVGGGLLVYLYFGSRKRRAAQAAARRAERPGAPEAGHTPEPESGPQP